MKMAIVALRLIEMVQRFRGLACILARMTVTAVMQASLAIIAMTSQNQKNVGSSPLYDHLDLRLEDSLSVISVSRAW
jgi:hypothetical protein